MFSRLHKKAVSGTQFDFSTIADALVPYGHFTPEHTMMAGAQLHFRTAPCILEALGALTNAGLFGYTESDEPEYLQAIVRWMAEIRAWNIQQSWIVPTYGTLQAISAAIRAFTQAGDGVIVQPPAYVLYNRVLERTHRTRVENPLLLKDGRYFMDLAQLETCMADPRNKLLLLCNPHNPIMDVWEPETLAAVAALAKKHGVLVIADEIFAEHVFAPAVMTPYATVPGAADNCIITTSLGKAFNFTGVSHANIVIPDPDLRARFIAQRNEDHYGSLSPFMFTALLAAYTPAGKEWIDALLAHVAGSIARVETFLTQELPTVSITRHTAGTLVWMDFRGYGLSEAQLEVLFARAGVVMDAGSKYGAQGSGFFRVQLGMPDAELLRRLAAWRRFSTKTAYDDWSASTGAC